MNELQRAIDDHIEQPNSDYFKDNGEEWYCIVDGKYYPKWQKTCDRCMQDDTIEEGDW